MRGPQWLHTTENNWPKTLNCDFSSTDPCESEEQVFTFACELNTASVINLSTFRTLQKLVQTSWVLRFVHSFRTRLNKRCNELTTEEIDGVEKFWIQLVQRDASAEEVNCLRASKLLLKTSVILEFNPFLDTDELIRVGGRLQKSKFSYLQIVTDNAKTFKKSELELKNLRKVISDPTVKAFYVSHKIYWQFIIEQAPW
ncbi:integrase catalytic domain-containing protein [Trichonephila clavipes]|nr:integrase catalytic domain-containing protein [Trichonephila clavipes]